MISARVCVDFAPCEPTNPFHPPRTQRRETGDGVFLRHELSQAGEQGRAGPAIDDAGADSVAKVYADENPTRASGRNPWILPYGYYMKDRLACHQNTQRPTQGTEMTAIRPALRLFASVGRLFLLPSMARRAGGSSAWCDVCFLDRADTLDSAVVEALRAPSVLQSHDQQ